jgi:hypothetical protein
MYVRVLQDELQFPDDRAIDQDTKSLIRGVRGYALCFALATHNYVAALATESRAQNLRAADKTASLLFHDVRSFGFPKDTTNTMHTQRLVACVLQTLYPCVSSSFPFYYR